MQEEHDERARFWDERTEEFLEGYCFAKGTEWYDHYDGKITQHLTPELDVVYTWDEPGEEE